MLHGSGVERARGRDRCVESASYEQRIQELDLRQDEVLERLAELDAQVQSLIDLWAPKREERPTSQSDPSLAPDADTLPSPRRAA